MKIKITLLISNMIFCFLRLLELQTWTLIFPVILRWVVLTKFTFNVIGLVGFAS